MRLSKERFEMIKNADCSMSCADCELSDCCYSIQELIDEIEALQQEKEQLKTQVAVMREALTEAIYYIKLGGLSSIGSINNTYKAHISVSSIEKWEKVLSNNTIDYHNPADVEALKKAREALGQATYTEELLPDWEYKKIVYEAIEAIDKVLGGDHDD
jgi:uncharacterized coiled-coil DUF342 family protein